MNDMLPLQLEFFRSEEECEILMLKKTIEEVKLSSDKVRKGTYARINELNKECVNIKVRLEIIESNICKG